MARLMVTSIASANSPPVISAISRASKRPILTRVSGRSQRWFMNRAPAKSRSRCRSDRPYRRRISASLMTGWVAERDHVVELRGARADHLLHGPDQHRHGCGAGGRRASGRVRAGCPPGGPACRPPGARTPWPDPTARRCPIWPRSWPRSLQQPVPCLNLRCAARNPLSAWPRADPPAAAPGIPPAARPRKRPRNSRRRSAAAPPPAVGATTPLPAPV